MANHLLIMGPPGSGKGTHAKTIAEHFSIPAISTGDIFRSHVKGKTALGLEVESILAAGDYVPDIITNEVVRGRLAQADCAPGFLLDGYPRTVSQVEALDLLLGDKPILAVIVLKADTEELIRRMLARAQAENRSDDDEHTIRHRQELYERETKPLLAVYGKRNLVVEVNAMGTIEEVSQRIIDAVTDHKE